MSSVPRGEEFEPYRAGWGIWTRTVKSLKRDTDALSFNMDVFNGEEFTFALREDGSEVRSMTKLRASQSWNSLRLNPFICTLNLKRKLNDIDQSHKFNEIKCNVSLRSWGIMPLQSWYSDLNSVHNNRTLLAILSWVSVFKSNPKRLMYIEIITAWIC